ncbi:MAG: restriction endonuclease subunit S [Cetobacterium sp.]
MKFKEWKKYKLIDVCTKIGSGSTPRGGASVYKKNGVSLIRSQNIYNNSFVNTGLVFIDDYAAEKLKNVKIEEKDVLLNITGDSVARCTIVPKRVLPARVNQHVCILRANSKYINSFYLKSYLVNNKTQEKMLSLAKSGGTRPALTKSMIENLEIDLPPLQTQEKIASILSALDDKIEINNEMNKTLEEMAQTLFKRWFIDFDFPNENGEPYRSSGGKMVDSELGEIPEGWIFDNISEFFDITIGKTPPRKETQWFSKNEKDIKWASIKDLGEAGVYILNTGEKITREAIEKFNIKKVESNTVILSFKLTIGRVVITNEAMITNEAIAHFTNKNITNITEFLYLYLKNFNYNSLGNTSSIATAVNSKIIKNIPFYLPNEKLISKFNEIITKIFEQIRENQQEIQSLTEIRDTLLPKLMSGEVEV